ncbi:MAG: hypothetical protein M5U29_00825 [Anaerolineae bacterium]|nr:hypothetical protein [Anaerolineae bacterium]
MATGQQGVGTVEFVAGLIVGFVISAPLVAWLSPRSGEETRQAIVQRGLLIRRRVGETVRGPLEQVQQQLEQIKGESLEDALAEGKTIAARRWPLARDSQD